MRMRSIALGLVVSGVLILSGCTEKRSIVIEDDFDFTKPFCFIQKLELVTPNDTFEVYPDTVVEVRVYASNVGPEVGWQEFYFSINGQILQMKNISFLPGEDKIVTFSTACSDCKEMQSYLSDVGKYMIAVNNYETILYVIEPPIIFSVEAIDWRESGPSDDPYFLPYIMLYAVNSCDQNFTLDSWEIWVDNQIKSNIIVTQFSTISVLSEYAEGRLVLLPNGVHAEDKFGTDVDFSWLRLRASSDDKYLGGIIAETML